jgi:hypothetical protein
MNRQTRMILVEGVPFTSIYRLPHDMACPQFDRV